MLDTHAHLCDGAFQQDLDDVLARSREAGVHGIVAVGETLEDARFNVELARLHPDRVLPAAGLFPTILDLEECERLEAWIREHAVVLRAIGEVGLDYWKVPEGRGREVQEAIFRRFVELALEFDLPVNVHSRAAGAATIERLLEWGATKVQMHAFDGRAASARAGVEAGFLFSVPPSIARSRQKQKLVRQLPLECLLLETDSPVLGPEAEVRNEPANLLVSLRAVAEIKGLSQEAVLDSVEENEARLYPTAPRSVSLGQL